MSNMFSVIIRYIRYYLNAKTIYDIHSPFAYDFITEVLNSKGDYYAFEALEYQRKVLLSNDNKLAVVDLGAGSRMGMGEIRKISQIASSSLGPKRKLEILFRIANYYKVNQILELGTSLGLSALYFSKARQNANIDTVEGSPEVAKIAQKMFDKNIAKNISLHVGNFDELLPVLLNTKKYDLVYVDGNHTYIATKQYFDMIINSIGFSGIIVFDDINWSKGMLKAWEELIQNEKVTLSINIFDIGILFFNKDLTKQDITFIDYFKKPWRIGLF